MGLSLAERYCRAVDDEAVLELARDYWSDPGGDDWAEVLDHATSNSEDLPRVIVALVATLPADRNMAFIGTGPIEDMHYGGASGDVVVGVLRKTGLDGTTIATILSGVWPELLEELGMRVHLRGLLSTAQIDWLLDASAPGRSGSL